MDDVYRRLARKLDRLPQGFPATESGVELTILAKIFSPEDAERALKLKPIPQTAAVIARRFGVAVTEAETFLDAMAEKGQIASMVFRGRQCYCVVPFVVGIWEYQVERLDAELAALFEEYAPTLLRTLGGSAPAIARVVPVNVSLDVRPQVLRHEDLRGMMERAQSFRLMDCLCRKERELEGYDCPHTRETCLAFSRQPDAYDRFPSWGRSISRDEALEVLAASEREGLVHATYNVQHEQLFVCNCCSCCCGFLRGLRDYHAPHVIVRSNYVAEIDAASCAVCGDCAGGRCPMDAIAEGEDAFVVDAARCIGCGVCIVTCPTDAITLEERPAAERTTPPPTLVHWHLERATNRSGALHGLALKGWLAWEALRGGMPR